MNFFKQVKNLFKKIVYGVGFNITIELSLCVVLTIIVLPIKCIPEIYHKIGIVLVICAILSILNIVWQKSRNKYDYFLLVKCLFCRNMVLVIQNVSKKRDMNICPKVAFENEMKKILEDATGDMTFYCVTQSYIVYEIKKQTKLIFKEKVYSKKINGLKKQLVNNACNKCEEEKRKTCSTNNKRKRKTTFYAVAFKKNVNHQ